MSKTALIFGAGKTGRGFAAQLAFLSGYDIILIDKNKQLVTDLLAANAYTIETLGNPSKNTTIKPLAVFHIDDPRWHTYFITTNLIFTAVFGNNLDALANSLAAAFEKRYQHNLQGLLTIITCENMTDAAAHLKTTILRHLGNEKVKWFSTYAGFSESIVFRTCLQPAAHQPQLNILAQDFFELPCDADELKEALNIKGLKPLKYFRHQLRRKIYTYNCINAVITYLGAKKGYTQLSEAANDEKILTTARKAARESCDAQVAEFNFPLQEQQEWMDAAFAKFADKNIPDPIQRNAVDARRKLGREDRLIGPALLALKHNIHPEGLVAGILACMEYRDADNPQSITDDIHTKGADEVLQSICGLSANEELFLLLKKQILTTA